MFLCAQAMCHVNITYSTCLLSHLELKDDGGGVTGEETPKQTITVPVVVALVSLSLLDVFNEIWGLFQLCLW